jgi:hypothetical protein
LDSSKYITSSDKGRREQRTDYDLAMHLVLLNCVGEGDFALFPIKFGFGRRAEDFGAAVVELAFPSRDNDRRQTVTDEVHAGTAHVHELVDAEDYGDADRVSSWGSELNIVMSERRQEFTM